MTPDSKDEPDSKPATKSSRKRASAKKAVKKATDESAAAPDPSQAPAAEADQAAAAPSSSPGSPDSPDSPEGAADATPETSGDTPRTPIVGSPRDARSAKAKREDDSRATESESQRASGRAADEATDHGHDSEEKTPVISEPPGDEAAGGSKRRRRRRKKSQGDEDERAEPNPAKRPQLDRALVEAKAWKIFKAEVAEEGLALIHDNDAKEISRRSFRLAEIFLEEASRRP